MIFDQCSYVFIDYQLGVGEISWFILIFCFRFLLSCFEYVIMIKIRVILFLIKSNIFIVRKYILFLIREIWKIILLKVNRNRNIYQRNRNIFVYEFRFLKQFGKIFELKYFKIINNVYLKCYLYISVMFVLYLIFKSVLFL